MKLVDVVDLWQIVGNRV